MHPLHPKKRFHWLYILLLLGVIIIFNPADIQQHITNSTHTLLLPLERFTLHHGTQTKTHLFAIKNIFQLQEIINTTKEQNFQLQAQLAAKEHLEKTNILLREQLALPPKKSLNILGADILYKQLGGNAWILINRGRADGLQVDDVAVIGDHVFLGVVFALTEHTAYVRLSVAEQSVLRVIKAHSHESAVAHGSHGTTIRIEHIDPQVTISIGERYLYAPEDRVFLQEAALAIGTVQRVTTTQDRLSQTAYVTPLYNPQTLTTVFIITSKSQ